MVLEEVFINDKRYTLIMDFKDNAMYRKSYNSLTKKTYGFDFEQWYQNGYWGNRYLPYSLMDGDTIIANVSVSIQDFLVLGENKKYIQIGTVMTDSAYKNQGFSRFIMEKILAEWANKCDMIYLFANDSVVDFYPKFGFTAVNEYQYSMKITNGSEQITAEKLDMSLDGSCKLLEEKVTNSMSMSNLAARNNVGLIMFYCLSFMSDNVYYLREQNVIVIAEFQNDTLRLIDIFSPSMVDLDTIIKPLCTNGIEKVIFGFTPNDITGYSVNLLKEDDTTLFVMKDKADLFENHKIMFPVLSHS
jgi:predicted N-acetyltransferase YhbS